MLAHRTHSVIRSATDGQDGYGENTMVKKRTRNFDAFSLGLGGTTAVTSFTMAPAIAHDQLRQDVTGKVHDNRGQKRWHWVPRRFRVA